MNNVEMKPGLIMLLTWLIIMLSSPGIAQQRPKVGLVLSGGGAYGLAHIGVIKVLEEEGIKIDFVGGTSMGAIIAALYATNHNADSLIAIAKTLNWNSFFDNEIDRKFMSIPERQDNDRYALSVSARQFKLQLPSGLSSGQNVHDKFSQLLWPYLTVTDFQKLPVPFLCIATNFENGMPVVLDHGYLPDVLRASMSIPSLFTPVNIDSIYYTDGGATDNFPVKEVKNKGMDFIIGVDFNNPIGKSLLPGNLGAILFQTSFVHARNLRSYSESLCNILISPNLQKYSESNYNDADSLIALGEAAAREHLCDLRALADTLKKYQNEDDIKALPSSDYYIDEIKYSGLSVIDSEMLSKMLDISIPGSFTYQDLKKAVQFAYASQYFSSVNYKIETIGNRNILTVRVVEKPPQQIQLGFHYDNDVKVGVFFNFKQRHLLIKASQLSFEATVSSFQRYKIEYCFPLVSSINKDKTGFNLTRRSSLGIELSVQSLDPYTYDSTGFISGNFHYVQYRALAYMMERFTNNLNMLIGYEYHNAANGSNIIRDPVNKWAENSMQLLGSLEFDSYDDLWFPTSGMRSCLGAEYSVDVRNIHSPMSSYWYYYFSNEEAFEMLPGLSLITGINTSSVQGPNIFWDNLVYVGGQNNAQFGVPVIPFIGYDLFEIPSRNNLILKSNVQWNFYGKQYLTGKVNLGNVANQYSELFKQNNLLFGCGLTYSVKTFAGPIEFTLMKAKDRSIKSYVSLGVWF